MLDVRLFTDPGLQCVLPTPERQVLGQQRRMENLPATNLYSSPT